MARSSIVLVTGILALFASAASASTSRLAAGDATILNFALNLEYLEAQFYACAAFGSVLSKTLTGPRPGQLIGCKPNANKNLSAAAAAYAASIAIDEIAHVAFIRQVLTAYRAPVASMPDIDIGPAFEKAADLAAAVAKVTDKGLTPKFDAYGNDIFFYHAAFIFEDVGVTAYKGAANQLQNKEILEAAAGILATEAYHGGAIRALLLAIADKTVEVYGLKVRDIVQAISGLRAFASGKKDDFGLFRKGTNQDLALTGEKPEEVVVFAPADSNSVAFSRSVEQILNIVYLAGKGKGGFFPSGINLPKMPTTTFVIVTRRQCSGLLDCLLGGLLRGLGK